MKTFSIMMFTILLGIAMSFLAAIPTMLLWNYLLPVFEGHVSELDLCHALALNFLCHILFRSSSVSRGE